VCRFNLNQKAHTPEHLHALGSSQHRKTGWHRAGQQRCAHNHTKNTPQACTTLSEQSTCQAKQVALINLSHILELAGQEQAGARAPVMASWTLSWSASRGRCQRGQAGWCRLLLRAECIPRNPRCPFGRAPRLPRDGSRRSIRRVDPQNNAIEQAKHATQTSSISKPDLRPAA
jgi:hypothetical protein